jgi:hypothetical protein
VSCRNIGVSQVGPAVPARRQRVGYTGSHDYSRPEIRSELRDVPMHWKQPPRHRLDGASSPLQALPGYGRMRALIRSLSHWSSGLGGKNPRSNSNFCHALVSSRTLDRQTAASDPLRFVETAATHKSDSRLTIATSAQRSGPGKTNAPVTAVALHSTCFRHRHLDQPMPYCTSEWHSTEED